MTALWLNWELLARRCPMIRRYFDNGFYPKASGAWEESTRNFERALELDPRNLNTLDNIADSYANAPALC